MYEALRKTPHRAGNRERLKLLIDSRSEPWSAAERLSHRLLRAAGIKGWETNLPVRVAGQLFYIDIAFRQQKLAIEIDATDPRDGPGSVRIGSLAAEGAGGRGLAGLTFHDGDVARPPGGLHRGDSRRVSLKTHHS